MWRHGDIFIARIPSLPKTAKPRPNLTLAEGELTGHAHRIADGATATLYADVDGLYINVTAEHAAVVHQEHAAITLERGVYRVWRQREYTPGRIQTVKD